MTWPRIDAFRIKTGKTLAQVAHELGIGVSMLMMVKSGKRNLSSKALYRLEQAELAAGLSAPAEPPAAVFQTLEKQAPDFPNLGKTGEDFSKPWKNAPDYFQALEKRLDRLEAMLAELLRRL